MIKDMVFTLENSSFVRFYTYKVNLALDASDLRKQSSKFLMNFYIGHIILCRSLEEKKHYSLSPCKIWSIDIFISPTHIACRTLGREASKPRARRGAATPTRATPSRAAAGTEPGGGTGTGTEPVRPRSVSGKLVGAEVAFWAGLGPAGGPWPTKLVLWALVVRASGNYGWAFCPLCHFG